MHENTIGLLVGNKIQ